MMARQTDEERLSALLARQAALQRKIRTAKARLTGQARRDDARRKIIAGALALEHLTRNPGSDFAKILFGLLDEYVRPDERPLFEFLPQREAAPAQSEAAA